MRNRKKMNLAKPAAATATPANPKMPAISATIRNINAQFNMAAAFHGNNERTRFEGIPRFSARSASIL
jgi:hypothetical protein